MTPASHVVLLECMHWYVEKYDADQINPTGRAERVCTADLHPHASSVMVEISPQGLGIYRAVYLPDPGVQLRPRLTLAPPILPSDPTTAR
jgi:hypothetical protein